MKTAFHTSYAPVRKIKVGAKAIKRIYKNSLKKIKKNPASSIGIVTIGAGLLSGVYLLSKFIKH